MPMLGVALAPATGHAAVGRAETTGGAANTWTNYTNAGGTAGPRIAAYATVQISCKVRGFQVADGNPWWYRVGSSPWNDSFYVSADAFYNNGATSGSLRGTPWVDPAVPDCGAAPGAPEASTASVTLARGPAAPAGYRYAITLTGFTPNTAVSVRCYDSVSPGGFYTFTLTTNTTGSAATQSYCYSGDGPDHWVVADGRVTSNHVTWTAAPGGGTSASGGATSGGSTSNSGGTAGYFPTHIRLRGDAGARERALLQLAPQLDKAATNAKIQGQTLAHIIYHEGGNYLSARKGATQKSEMLYSGSVGIGQMRVDTAKLVALKVYRDWSTVDSEDIVVRTNLIYNTDYALRYAAGYVALLQQAGISGDFQLFMAYSLSVDAAKAWKAKSYSMTPSVLDALGFNTRIFIERKRHYDDAVRAIGR
ncbi:hypothetical protein Drose_35890 [Dactylosporangium roseum]|uniref:Transglycosylase SLT domain-containing protein n=1 Tax=Dactylosporangium roseum TaxID=47989 RepID=A0ABY5Z7J4_9ACTN|nr:hypothetical protein [Dactylosporangium roseum]UWZ36359.1 hypothetical protein Drose_35890 [Dactylosporangium roseum]